MATAVACNVFELQMNRAQGAQRHSDSQPVASQAVDTGLSENVTFHAAPSLGLALPQRRRRSNGTSLVQVAESEFVDPQRLLLLLPADQLNEVRALLLERLGMCKKALR